MTASHSTATTTGRTSYELPLKPIAKEKNLNSKTKPDISTRYFTDEAYLAQEAIKPLSSVSTAATLETTISSAGMTSLGVLRVKSFDDNPKTSDLNNSGSHKKKKKKKSKLKDSPTIGNSAGHEAAYLSSVDGQQEFDRKMTVSEKMAVEKFRSSISSSESSLRSAQHTVASRASQATPLWSDKNGRNRGMHEIASDDNWACFPDVPSRQVDFPFQHPAGFSTESTTQHGPATQSSVRSPDLVLNESLKEHSQFLHQEQSPKIQKVQRAPEAPSMPIQDIIVHHTSDESSFFLQTLPSLKTGSSGESSGLEGNTRQHQTARSLAIQSKIEEAMRTSADPAERSQARPRHSSTSVVQSDMRMRVSPALDDVSQATPSDMLVKYLRSMGTSSRTAINIAARFREEQESAGHSPAALPARSSVGSRNSARSRILDEGASTGADDTPARRQGRSARSRARRQHAFSWERSMQPGAVQMQGRAFGAPARPVIPERYSEEDDDIVETVEAFEAMTVDDFEHGPIVYANSTPLSWKDLLMEKSLRRRFLILCFVIITIIVISVTLAVLNRPKYDEALISLTSSPSSVPSFTPTFIAEDILSYASKLSGPEPVSTPGTPQHTAVGWLSTFDIFSEGFSESFDQRYAMVTLFFSLGGDDWLEQDSWLDPDMHECDWSSAITCTVDGTGRRLVSGLDLTKNGLVGSLPPEIGLTTQLGFLRLSKNQIRGTVPSELFTLPLLSVLDLHKNDLVGSLPDNMGIKKDLVYLDVSYNRLTGMIPQGFVDLNLIRIADFKENQFSGPIPANLQKMKVISMLGFASNAFTGTIPEFEIDDLPEFDTIDLGDNLLTGTIPDWILSLLSRQDILIYSNFLTGTIPSSSSNHYLLAIHSDPEVLSSVRLETIDLSDNELTGKIPPWGAFLPTVEYLDFSNNKFVGKLPFITLPGEAREWINLETAMFANNLLTGTIPSNSISGMIFFDVSGNFLEGTVPANMSNMEYLFINDNKMLSGDIDALLSSAKNLTTLDAHNTSLTGRLEGSRILSLSNMEELDVSFNNITGTIPKELGELKLMKKIFLDSNQLSGSIPSEIGSMEELLVLSLTNNLLSGFLPQSLEKLTLLQSLGLSGNEKLLGNISEQLCSVETLNLTRDVIGCNLGCICCSDSSRLCEVGIGRSSNIFEKIGVPSP